MPKYTYFCRACEEVSVVKHSLGETCQICLFCESKDSLERRPSFVFIDKKTSQFGNESNPGEVIKSTIEEMKEELKTEQSRLKGRTIKDV